jgi:hypothetical protein
MSAARSVCAPASRGTPVFVIAAAAGGGAITAGLDVEGIGAALTTLARGDAFTMRTLPAEAGFHVLPSLTMAEGCGASGGSERLDSESDARVRFLRPNNESIAPAQWRHALFVQRR